MNNHFHAEDLLQLAVKLLTVCGMSAHMAEEIGGALVEADLLGHGTHGLALLSIYLEEIGLGHMALHGEPTVVSDHQAVVTWNGNWLPGQWLVSQALQVATQRSRQYGVGMVAIGRSHHIGCLAVYLNRVTRAGLVAHICSSAPTTRSVAPFGGLDGALSPNPIGFGIPMPHGDILIDVSTSITSNSLVGQYCRQKSPLPGPWLQDADGRITDNPKALKEGGTLLPLGGLDAGHKGFGLALMVEALTSGLAGYGRADQFEGIGASVLVQVFDPDAFSGRDRFDLQMQATAATCLESRPRNPKQAVRLPGQHGQSRRRQQLEQGIELTAQTVSELRRWAGTLSVTMPDPF